MRRRCACVPRRIICRMAAKWLRAAWARLRRLCVCRGAPEQQVAPQQARDSDCSDYPLQQPYEQVALEISAPYNVVRWTYESESL